MRLAQRGKNGERPVDVAPTYCQPILCDIGRINKHRPRPMSHAVFRKSAGSNGCDCGTLDLEMRTLSQTLADNLAEPGDTVRFSRGLRQISLGRMLEIPGRTGCSRENEHEISRLEGTGPVDPAGPGLGLVRRGGAGGPASSPSPKKILVELYTSQGCSSCPPASDLLGRLAKLGYGPDRVVALNFHVDYFNQPWVDPYSNPVAARRQGYCNEVLQRRDLSFTPLMVVDGCDPLVGSNRSAMLAALARADRGVSGDTNFDPLRPEQTPTVLWPL